MSTRRVLIEKIPATSQGKALKSRMIDLSKTISECKEEMKRLRELCKHEKYELGNYSWRIGHIELKKLCSYCWTSLGDPSIEEREAYEKK
ncbi:MAG: hypothetical protein Q8O88_04255 [bacterium]|nr:hypothetical protein [bacterium]